LTSSTSGNIDTVGVIAPSAATYRSMMTTGRALASGAKGRHDATHTKCPVEAGLGRDRWRLIR
jgi:hypothetical protein